jgi:hypothetical protein
VEEFRVLTADHDPFTIGTKSHTRDGEWFAEMWLKLRIQNAVHLRRVHYLLVSLPQPVLLARPVGDATTYENSIECFNYLIQCCTLARHLGIVPIEAFVDRRAPMPHLFADYDGNPIGREPTWEYTRPGDSWMFPTISHNLGDAFRLDLPNPRVTGYDYDQRDQPFHLEVWVEKSTQNDWLEPLCKQLHVNLITGVGFMSITQTINLLQRVQKLQELTEKGKRVRIMYIVDHDPAGTHMDTGVARVCEFYKHQFAADTEIKLTTLALTRAQCLEMKLPTIPVNANDLRKRKFEERYGEGQTELDAVEAIYPGRLEGMLRDAIEEYRDDEIEEELDEVGKNAQAEAETIWNDRMNPHRPSLALVEEAIQDVVAEFKPQVEDLQRRMNEAMVPVHALLKIPGHAVEKKVDDLELDLPERPVSGLEPPEGDDDWLYDSNRMFFEQMEAYREHKPSVEDKPKKEKARP